MHKKQEYSIEKPGKIDYNNTAFILKEPYSNKIVKGPIRLNSKADHTKLLAEARQKQLYIWYSTITNGTCNPIHIIDWDSIPDQPYNKPIQTDRPTQINKSVSELRCYKCGKKCFSTSGLTLHIKHAHNGE